MHCQVKMRLQFLLAVIPIFFTLSFGGMFLNFFHSFAPVSITSFSCLYLLSANFARTLALRTATLRKRVRIALGLNVKEKNEN